MHPNPPPLLSPVADLDVRAVLDQDATLTAGLAVGPDRSRAVVLVAAEAGPPYQREEFMAWGRALEEVSGVARIAPIAAFGHTAEGRAYLATYVTSSLVDVMRTTGQPDPQDVRAIGAVIADALATVHSYGLVHAAVSPATVLVDGDGVRLGGFGALAPGLAAPLGVWAFTAPEHRAAAVAGDEVGSAASDVFALAATMCVMLVGALPWSDPAQWADAAGVPSGAGAPIWATAIRAALAANPDQRPSAEDFAASLRRSGPAPAVTFHGARVDLRAFIPRRVRRLAASNTDAMSDGAHVSSGRAAPPPRRSRFRRFARRHRGAVGTAAALVAVAVAGFAYAAATGPTQNAAASGPVPATVSPYMLQLMQGAKAASQTFLHKVGAGDISACSVVTGSDVVTTDLGPAPITCADLVNRRSTLMSATALTSMRTATVLEVASLSDPVARTGENSSPGASPAASLDPVALVTLPYVPALQHELDRLEITMSFHNGRWWVSRVVVG